VFTIPDPWLAAAAIGAIGMRVAEWWNDDLGYRIDDVAATYAVFALRMLTDGQTAHAGPVNSWPGDWRSSSGFDCRRP
jgi:hypothetical protein